MSARDAESGSSTYKGGSRSAGGLGNGGIGGGMGGGGNWGGGIGGGAGRNGGIGNRTGLTTGNRMYGGMAVGRPGGPAMNPGAWGVTPAAPITTGPLSGVRPRGVVPASVPGINPVPETVPNVFNQNYLNSISDFVQSMKNRYGWGVGNPNVTPGPGPVSQPESLPPYAGPGTDPRVLSVPSPYGSNVYGMFNGNHMSVYGNPQLGTPTYGGLSNLKDYRGANYGYGGGPR